MKRAASSSKVSRFSKGVAAQEPVALSTQKELDSQAILPVWFSDGMVKDYLASFPARYAKASAGAKTKVHLEAELVGGLYLMLVYEIYPKFGQFRNIIDSDKELSSNFALVKSWLDSNYGKEAAETFKASVGQFEA